MALTVDAILELPSDEVQAGGEITAADVAELASAVQTIRAHVIAPLVIDTQPKESAPVFGSAGAVRKYLLPMPRNEGSTTVLVRVGAVVGSPGPATLDVNGETMTLTEGDHVTEVEVDVDETTGDEWELVLEVTDAGDDFTVYYVGVFAKRAVSSVPAGEAASGAVALDLDRFVALETLSVAKLRAMYETLEAVFRLQFRSAFASSSFDSEPNGIDEWSYGLTTLLARGIELPDSSKREALLVVNGWSVDTYSLGLALGDDSDSLAFDGASWVSCLLSTTPAPPGCARPRSAELGIAAEADSRPDALCGYWQEVSP